MSQHHTIPSLQGILAKRTKPTLQTNFVKKPFSPSYSNTKTSNTQKTKNSVSIRIKCLKTNKAQHTTCGIKHWGLIDYISISSRIKVGKTGQVSNPQFPTISYRHPLYARQERSKLIDILSEK